MQTIKVFLSAIFLLALIAQPGFAQDNTIFLPVVGSGAEQYIQVTGDRISDTSNIQPCSDDYMQSLESHDWAADGEPDYKAGGCLLTGGVTYPATWGVEPVVQSASEDTWFVNRKVVLNRLDCTTYCTSLYNGVSSIYSIMTGRKATLADNNSQHVAHWYSVGVVGNTSCGSNGSGRIHIGLGIGQGKVTQTLISPLPQFYYDVFANNSCTQTIYSFTVPQNVAIATQLSLTSYTSSDTKWSGSFWANGQWNYLFTNKSLYEPVPNYVMLGSEMGSLNGVFTNIYVPINFQHKIELYSKNAWWPWQIYSMPSPLSIPANSWSQTDAPWRLIDASAGDFTSIAIRAN